MLQVAGVVIGLSEVWHLPSPRGRPEAARQAANRDALLAQRTLVIRRYPAMKAASKTYKLPLLLNSSARASLYCIDHGQTATAPSRSPASRTLLAGTWVPSHFHRMPRLPLASLQPRAAVSAAGCSHLAVGESSLLRRGCPPGGLSARSALPEASLRGPRSLFVHMRRKGCCR